MILRNSLSWKSTCLRIINTRRTFHPTVAYAAEGGESREQVLRKIIRSYKKSYDVPKATLHLTSQNDIKNPKLYKIGDQVTVRGYLGKKSATSKIRFYPLSGRGAFRDAVIQLVSKVEHESKCFHKLEKVRYNSAISVTGTLQRRQLPEGQTAKYAEKDSATREELEIFVTDVTNLNPFPADVILSEKAEYAPEQRHLQLMMNAELSSRLRFRAKAALQLRNKLDSLDFQEVETPVLFKSTPEGAREFLVPTRKAGYAYALPQSPQQYKQILMGSGINKYFQFAKCFRDEDLRADRQPEFTQLDLEIAFADGEQVMNEVESLMSSLFTWAGLSIPSPIHRMTYKNAMDMYGSDKPDVRLKYKIRRIEHIVPEQLKKMMTDIPDPIIEILKLPISEDPSKTRDFIASFLDHPDSASFRDNIDGPPGIFIYDSRKPLSGLQAFGFEGAAKLEELFEPKNALASLLEESEQEKLSKSSSAFQDGDLLVVQARPNTPHQGGSTALGRLRLAINSAAITAELLPPLPKIHKFLWITDFPLFTPDNTSTPGSGEGQRGRSGFSSTHHPFTAPKSPEDVELLISDPLRAKADHYDLVVNGVELGGGSRRIHRAEIQELVLKNILKLPRHLLSSFSHLLSVLRTGCPPHAGFALGFDRLIAVMLFRDSIRDVIAFPKNGKGQDLLVGSPSEVKGEQLGVYGLELKGEGGKLGGIVEDKVDEPPVAR